MERVVVEYPIFLDNNSTTRVDPRVLEQMLPYLSEQYGNASSTSHTFGLTAEKAVADARDQVANLLNCRPQEIIFTSGATEANNLALLGVMRSSPPESKLIIAAAEHKAVIDPAEQLRNEGFEVATLPVDKYGSIRPEQVEAELNSSTALVSIMHGNNEVGTINPIKEIASLCKKHEILLHTDATQTVGKLPINLKEIPIDLLSLSGHKMYGPKGIGALFVRRQSPKISISPLVFGGGHERKLRSGTLPVHQIVGLGAACQVCSKELKKESARISSLREQLKTALEDQVVDISFNGHPENRLPGNLHISIPGANSEAVMMKLRNQLAISSGSACTMSSPEPSHVLKAMELQANELTTSLRMGIGRFNTGEEILEAAKLIASAVAACRQLSGYQNLAKNA